MFRCQQHLENNLMGDYVCTHNDTHKHKSFTVCGGGIQDQNFTQYKDIIIWCWRFYLKGNCTFSWACLNLPHSFLLSVQSSRIPGKQKWSPAQFKRTVQGDHSGCLKPPVDFDFIARHISSGGYFVSWTFVSCIIIMMLVYWLMFVYIIIIMQLTDVQLTKNPPLLTCLAMKSKSRAWSTGGFKQPEWSPCMLVRD